MAAELQLDGETVRLSGVLDRAAAIALWPQLSALARVVTVDVQRVTTLDSAGLALLVELVARGGQLHGQIPGQAELAAAYRLDARPGLPSQTPA